MRRKKSTERFKKAVEELKNAALLTLMVWLVCFMCVACLDEKEKPNNAEIEEAAEPIENEAKEAVLDAIPETMAVAKVPAEPIKVAEVELIVEVTEKPVEAVEPEPEKVEPLYTEDELRMLATVIYCEAGADYIEDSTRQMVGEVVLNRVASEYFPNTIEEVLTAPYQYGRFYWTGVVFPERANYDCEKHAVVRAYECAEALLSGSVERLLPTDTIWQAEFTQGTETVVYQDGIYFCR